VKNLNPKRFAWVLFGVFVLSFLLIAMWSGKTIDDLWSAVAIAYKTIPVMLGAVAVFVSSAWRWRIFRGWLVPFPDLNGTWHGTIQTTWTDPQTGSIPGPIPAVLTIKQSFIRLSCVMRTAEMTSRSCFADFWLDRDEQIRMLGYSYHSTPLPSVVDRSALHDGTVVLEIVGNPARKLKGQYWTSRKTTGEVKLEFKTRMLMEEFPGRLGPHPVSGRME